MESILFMRGLKPQRYHSLAKWLYLSYRGRIKDNHVRPQFVQQMMHFLLPASSLALIRVCHSGVEIRLACSRNQHGAESICMSNSKDILQQQGLSNTCNESAISVPDASSPSKAFVICLSNQQPQSCQGIMSQDIMHTSYGQNLKFLIAPGTT